MRASTMVMAGFAAVFGLIAVFLSQVWLDHQADQRMKTLEAQTQVGPERTIVVARHALRFGDELDAGALLEVPWPGNAVPQGAFKRIADLTSGKRVVLMPIDVNEAVLASKVTGPGQRATLSAMLEDGRKAVTIRVNDVDGVAGFVLPGDHVDVLLTQVTDKNTAMNDLVIENAKVLAIDQLADERTDKPSVVKAVTLEVSVTDGQKISLAARIGTLSLLLRKAGDVVDDNSRRLTLTDLGGPAVSSRDHRTVVIINGGKRQDYVVPVGSDPVVHAAVAGPSQHTTDVSRSTQ